MCIAAIIPAMAALGGTGAVGALTLGSGALGAYSAISSGNAAAAAATADARVASLNANLINDRIADERIRAGDENRRQGLEAAHVIGQQTVGAAAGGLDIGFGSPLQALLASADAAGRDAAHIMDNSARNIRDLRQEQANYRTSARSSRAQASGLRKAGYLQAGGAVLGAGSDFAKYKATIK